jgi:adenylate cyclase
MAEQGRKRKLAAILSADVVGYGRLMQDDEAATVTTLQEYRTAIGRVIDRHDGRIVNAPGDNILAEFPSAVEAVQGACEIQQVLKGRNLELRPERRMEFRIGVNLGDVIEEADGTIYGDGVNIAARMEALADSGGVCISNTVYESVEGKLDFGVDFLGEQQVKNVARPVRVYRVRAEAREPEHPPLALPDKPSIAVLPFDNLSGDSEQQYFVDGLTEDVITALSHNRELFVIARNSSFKYKGEAVDVATVARELGVRYVVEGSVRRAGERVRVTAQLIDAATAGHLWAETYDRELSDIFAVQDDLTSQITVRVGAAVEELGTTRAQRKAPEDMTAYDLVLRARKSAAAPNRESYAHDRELLERAVELDPTYVRAHANLALLYVLENNAGVSPIPDPVARAGEAAKRAVELDPSDAKARYALAMYRYYNGDRELFEIEAKRALALNPNDAEALQNIGLGLQHAFGMDRLAEGAAMARRAMRLNPRHEGWWRWATWREYYLTGRYQEALAELNKMDNPDDYLWDQGARAWIHGHLGNEAAARAARDKVLEINPDYTLAWHLAIFKVHESYHPAYIESARKAGLPLGDLEGLEAETQ